MAQSFDGVGNPIVGAKNAKVSDYNGVTLSGREILINSDIEIAHKLKRSALNLINLSPMS